MGGFWDDIDCAVCSQWGQSDVQEKGVVRKRKEGEMKRSRVREVDWFDSGSSCAILSVRIQEREIPGVRLAQSPSPPKLEPKLPDHPNSKDRYTPKYTISSTGKSPTA